tara:strand:+ start:1532 stop:1744 length:213 start_codon:yes stop_codon:yes gene_type:complete
LQFKKKANKHEIKQEKILRIMNEKDKEQRKLIELFKKLKLHYKKHGYSKRKQRSTNPMWGIDPKRIKETE